MKDKIISVLETIAINLIWLSLIAFCAFIVMIIVHKLGEIVYASPYPVSLLLIIAS